MRILRRLSAATVLVAILLTAAAAPSSAPASGRITNGSDVADGQYQSQLRPLVALVSLDADSQWDGQFCAGTLIDPTHVLTAGHCIVEDEDFRARIAPSSVGVLAGHKDLSDTAMDRASLVPVNSIFVNPNFNIRTMRWDAAILRLGAPITSVPVMPRLTAADEAALGMGTSTVTAVVAGWGDTNPNSDGCCFPTSLKGANIPVHPNATCSTNLANAPGISFDTEFQFCAGRLAQGGTLGSDTCQGDSGGPLLVDVGGVTKHAGVTSFGVGCGQSFFGVYARTTALQGWIDSIPGIVEGDARDESHGPGDTAAPTVTGVPKDFKHARITITPATSGTPVSKYTVWVRDGAPRSAKDVFIGTTTSLVYDVQLPAINSLETFQVLVRPNGQFGDGPSAFVRTRPQIDSVRPSIPSGLRVSRAGAMVTLTWRASIDRQSGPWGYYVQRRVNGRWTTPKLSRALRFAFRAGSTHGSLRVLAEDWADNRSAYSAAVMY
jgi:secreted trypsin-like serine protease